MTALAPVPRAQGIWQRGAGVVARRETDGFRIGFVAAHSVIRIALPRIPNLTNHGLGIVVERPLKGT